MIKKKLLSIGLSLLLPFIFSGCTEIDAIYNAIVNLKPDEVQDSVPDSSGQTLDLNDISNNNLSNKDINEVDQKLKNLLKTDMVTNESLDEFKTLFMEYIVLLKDNPSSINLVVSMDKAIKDSNLYGRDLDNDYVPDLIEMTVTNTAPLLNKSQDNLRSAENKLDGKCNFTISHLLVKVGNTIQIITPAFSDVIESNINSGVITPTNNTWMKIESKVYGENISSYMLQTVDPQIPPSLGVKSIYPISYMTSGYNGALLTDVEYHYNNNNNDEAGTAIIVSQDMEKMQVNTDDYLFRTNTVTTSKGKITPNTIYSLVYPKLKK